MDGVPVSRAKRFPPARVVSACARPAGGGRVRAAFARVGHGISRERNTRKGQEEDKGQWPDDRRRGQWANSRSEATRSGPVPVLFVLPSPFMASALRAGAALVLFLVEVDRR